MPAKGKSALAQVLDLPLAIAAALTVAYYWFITQPSMAGTLLHRYTTEHVAEYVTVSFFIWGLTDAVFRALSLPREMLALGQDWLPRRSGREPVARAAALLAYLNTRPRWLLESRLGQRLTEALTYLEERGSADEFDDQLRHLAEKDLDATQGNYGLIRFICIITPMFGFLGTVVHFGTALGGQSAGDIADKLPTVVAEMGTAFNTTTVALVAATSMMFALFLCERAERAIVLAIDRRTNEELLNRFELLDANMTPYLSALQLANKSSLQAIDGAIERQMSIWSRALETLLQKMHEQQERQTLVWSGAMDKLEQRFESNDEKREKRLLRILEKMETERKEHGGQMQATTDHVATLKTDFSKLVEQLSAIAKSEGQLSGSQAILADNLRVLRETQQIDQALHGLTAAIHLLTARNSPTPGRESRAA